MKIYWCHSHFLHWLGSSKYIFEVVKVLSKKYKVTIVASVLSPQAVSNFTSIGIRTVSLNDKSTNSILYWLNLKRNINRESEKLRKIVSPNDLIISSMFPMNCIAERLSNMHIQCCWEPYALFYDNNYIEGFSWLQKIFIFFVSFFYRNLDLTSTRKAAKIITLSEFTKVWIGKIYKRKDALISYEGVDTKFFKKSKNANLENKYRGKKIIFHSTDFTAVKGTKYLIDTFPKVLKVFPNTKLLISSTIDNPHEKRKYMYVAKNFGFDKNIEFLGSVDYKLLPAYYSLAGVVVQPSIKQNMSLPVKEAMSCETPIVTLKEGYEQTPDGWAGLLVDSRNSEEIAEAIIKIIGNEKLSIKMGKIGRKIILRKFSWDRVAKVFDEAICSTVAKVHRIEKIY
jgi:glycosyltransferase involved in cell wall biosynthesis